ncbi:Bug family tripartite tricarboxylate transporter substrate binding protein [Ottowia sp. VDI28]|uniref:Bug family tripartite tricarboxylate transporter substrate binding protein n=1 Tax=Ottowia sp. VDI28 TaxID=3133968 RepID=UPI003C2E4028
MIRYKFPDTLLAAARHGLLLAAGTALCLSATAQEYPSRPIKMLVPYSAGGTLDIVARNLAKLMEPSLGQPVVVENIPGASGVIAHAQLARASADGYTVAISGLSPLALVPHQHKNLSYKPLKDFSYLACFGDTPLVLDVGSSSPARSLQQLVADAKANPGKLNYGSSGIGNSAYLAAAMFAREAGIELTHVPYKGNAPAMADLVSGQIQILFDPPQTTLPQVQAGKVRALAVTSPRRFAGLPDVPTIAESGWPSFQLSLWYALIAPAGIPAPVIEKLNRAMNQAVAEPGVKQRFAAQGSTLQESTPQGCDAEIRKEYAHWARTFEQLGIKPE